MKNLKTLNNRLKMKKKYIVQKENKSYTIKYKSVLGWRYFTSETLSLNGSWTKIEKEPRAFNSLLETVKCIKSHSGKRFAFERIQFKVETNELSRMLAQFFQESRQ